MIPAVLLAFGLIFLSALCFVRARPRSRLSAVITPEPLTVGIAIMAAAAAFIVVVYVSNWRGDTEIAWVGLRSIRPDAPLQIGGSDDATVTAWPNHAPAPVVRVAADGEYSISRGGGFVRNGDGYLNGDALGLTQAVDVAGLRVRLERWWVFWRKVTVERPSGERLGSFRVTQGRRDRVVDMVAVVQESVISLRSGGEATVALELERWAYGLRLLVARDSSQHRILDREREYRARLTFPAEWTVRWTGGSLPLAWRVAAGAVVADFLPPWRATSPLPPRRPDEQTSAITFTGRALPGDRAFVFPLGAAIKSFRADLPVVSGRFTQCLEDVRTSPFIPKGSSSEPGWQAVTCTREVETGPVAFRLATIRDLPRWGYLVTTLLLPVLLLAWGMRLCLRRQRPDDRWTVSGLVCVVWLILLYRWLLAIRYAADPAYLDPLAVRGVTMAAIALALVPAFMLATARIWRDQYLDLQSEGGVNAVVLRLVGYAAATLLLCVSQAWIVRRLWPNMPAAYSPVGQIWDAAQFVAVCAIAWVAFAVFVVFEYIYNAWFRQRLPSRGMAVLQACVGFVWSLFRRAVRDTTGVWQTIASGATAPVAVRNRYLPVARSSSFFLRRVVPFYWAALLVLLVIGAGVYVAGIVWSGKFLQELFVPMLLCWVPASILLGARKIFAPGTSARVSAWRTLPVVPPLVILAVFLFPIIVNDVGGIVATLSVFLPLSLLLLAGGRPWKLSALPILTLAGAFALAAALYMQMEVVTGPFGIGQAAGARVLLWKSGASGAQEALLWANLPRTGKAPLRVNYRRLSDAIEHATENRMMAHEGQWRGLGHGNAPTRLSRIRQDTLQYDSTYAFFVVGDSGAVGGVCLLLLFGIPLVLVLMSARSLFDPGHGLAAVATAAMWLAALAHASMNLGLLPFTGRNLPLLSVNSPSDLALWTLLLCLTVQALLWRVSGHDQIWATDSDSLISPTPPASVEPTRRFAIAATLLATPPALLLVWIAAGSVSVARDTKLAEGFDWSEMLRGVNALALNKQLTFDPKRLEITSSLDIPADTVLGQEIALFNSLPDDEKLDGTFPHAPRDFSQRLRRVRTLADYDALMRYLRDHDEGETTRRRPPLFEIYAPDEFADTGASLRYAGAEHRIVANPSYNTRVSLRSGAGPDDFPHVVLRGGGTAPFLLRGGGIEIPFPTGRGAGDRAIILTRDGARLKIISDTNPAGSVVRVFLRMPPAGKGALRTYRFLRAEATARGPMVRAEEIDLQLRPGKGGAPRRLQLNIDTAITEGDVLEVPGALADDFRPSLAVERTSRGALIGSAWVRGHTVLAYAPDPLVPWTRTLAEALSVEWRRRGRTDAAARFGTLTIDRGLQAAAQEFVATKGRERHRDLLGQGGAREALPPRVALSVLSLPSGEVLSMGGWPRMQSDQNWAMSTHGDIPAIGWAEERAPKQLRRRYAGDRNFDRLIMGSATKPVFAASVLALHKNLDRQLMVAGGNGEERTVFGIELDEPAWDVPNSTSLNMGRWADFQSYLALSDNRYQLRLGFLGLVEPGAGNVVPAHPGAVSPSAAESMDGGAKTWGRYPEFPPDIEFTYRQPKRLRNLDHTPLADRLSKMFGIGIRGDDVLRRYSFWTSDEADDVPAPAGVERPSRALFSSISPEPPQFGLQRLESARGYVSLLLGGDENMWANVDFAGAFATAVTGQPVVPHVTVGGAPVTTRVEFTDVARKLRPGLEAVVTHARGTAHDGLAGSGALAWLADLQAAGYKVYAKTGTLAEGEGRPSTSRLVLAIVRWNGNKVEKGSVFSFVIERGHVGLATRWLGEFLAQNGAAIRLLL